MFEDARYSDATVVIHGRELPVHRSVLCAVVLQSSSRHIYATSRDRCSGDDVQARRSRASTIAGTVWRQADQDGYLNVIKVTRRTQTLTMMTVGSIHGRDASGTLVLYGT
jgi:hypothetical protein